MFAKIQGYLAEPLARSSMFKRACHLRRIRSFSNDRRFDVVFVIAVTEINNYIRSTQALLSTIHTIQMHIYIYISHFSRYQSKAAQDLRVASSDITACQFDRRNTAANLLHKVNDVVRLPPHQKELPQLGDCAASTQLTHAEMK